MSRLSLDGVRGGGETLSCRLTPGGRIDVGFGAPGDGPQVAAGAAGQIVQAFQSGRGEGVLHLGAAELSTELPPALAYWRDLGKALIVRVCGALDPFAPGTLAIPEPDPDTLSELAQAAPPMEGAELLSPELLRAIWSDTGAALSAEAGRCPDGVQGYLRRHGSVWNVVGRVCFHLAENKGELEYPFAFIATYVHLAFAVGTPVNKTGLAFNRRR